MSVSRLTYIEAPCKSVLNRVQNMHFKWSINPYTGCSHACRYCYARSFYLKAERGTAADFDRVIYVKTNAPEVLRSELSRRSWKREEVLIGASTDPYQPAEGRFRITRGVLTALAESRTPTSLITKGTLVLRDLDLLQQLRAAAGVEVHMTVASMDEAVWRKLEPGTPPPAARMAAVRRLNAAGIPTGVFLAPIMPGITDNEAQLRGVMEAAADAGAPYVVPIALRLQPGVREWFLPQLSRYFPHLTLQYCRLYQKVEVPPDYKRKVLGLAGRLLNELSLSDQVCGMEKPPALAPAAQQLRLSI
jgi:DNA repair photolyase